MDPEPLDAVHRVETPEGVRLLLRPAGPVARALAWGIDVSIRSTFYTGAAFAVFPLGGEVAVAIFVLVVFATEWLYPVFFEVLHDGRTPGKQAVGIRVVDDDGTPVGWASSLLRNLLLSADFLPGTYLTGLISMLASRDFRRLGDLAAGTLVVHFGAPGTVGALPEETLPQRPAVPLTLDEQRAVIAFGERVSRFSPERAEELAALAEPLLDGNPPREHLERIAAWLLGRRRDEASAPSPERGEAAA